MLAGDVLSPASTEDLTARIVEFVRTHLDVAAAPGDEPDDDGGAPASGGDAAGVAGAGAG